MATTPTAVSGLPRWARRQATPVDLSFCTIRPSLLDLRFTGDPWIVPQTEGRLALCLGDYQLVRFDATPLDVPSLNFMLEQARHRRPRAGCRTKGRPAPVC